MRYLLDLVYLVLLLLASPWLIFAAVVRGKYRDGWGQKLLGRVPRRLGQRRCLWLHAVSVGEVNLLAPLLERIERACPEVECVISTTTRTGYELARRKYSPRTVFYYPLDFSWAVQRALRRIRPDCLLLAELELWPNLLAAAARRGVRVALVNGRMSDRSFRGYRRLRPLVARWLRRVNLLAVQSQQYAERFLALGADPRRVRVTGSVKFDGATTDRLNEHSRRLARLWHLSDNQPVFLAGSTQAPEERLALEAFRLLRPEFPELRLIVVPRHPERFAEVAELLSQSGLPWTRRSTLSEGLPPGDPASILLVDTVGELGAWWGTATVGFVGGSMGSRGGQNMIEPAAYGVAVCFGPHTSNFRDVVELLLRREAAVVVEDGEQLRDFVRRCLEQPEFAAGLGSRAQQLVREQAGATDRTVALLGDLLGARTGQDAMRAA